MRIHLADDNMARRRKKRHTRRRRRRIHTFESAIAVPRAPAQRAKPKNSKKQRSPVGRSQQLPRRRRQPAQREATAASRSWSLPQVRITALRVLGVFVLFALIGTSAYASSDAKFFVYEATITGGKHVDPAIIYQAADVHERNIFWVDPEEVAERILELDGIRSVRVRCRLPARMTIEVEEREPTVMWRATSQDQDLWLDDEGTVLPYGGDVKSPSMVFIVDYSERDLQVGDRIEPDGVVQSVLQLAATLPGEQVFFYRSDRGLSFTHRVNGAEWPVYVGTSDALPRKIQVVQALTQHLLANGIQPRYVDVRWPEHPVYGDPLEGLTDGGG